MSSVDMWVALLIKYPGSAVVLVLGLISLVSYLAVLFHNVKNMQQVMVTKKDLSIALSKCIGELNGRYVTRREWDMIEHRTHK